MYQRIGAAAFKKDLTNIRKLCELLGSPQNDLEYIHVAGTNAKGTVSHLISAILQSMDKKVGLYTSPHYMDFRERIKVNGYLVPESYIVGWVAEHKHLFKEIRPSFFEITVAMAFCYFKDQSVEIVVLETGLGGRLDSTNIIEPILSVITHIALDHQNMLGDSIYQISKEKAGIIKPNRPVVIGSHQVSCDAVFIKTAFERNASISWASLNWLINSINKNSIQLTFGDYQIDYNYSLLESPFLVENMITALEAMRIYCELGRMDWNQEKIEQALLDYRSITNYIGRWEQLNDSPLTIVDSAHNIDALAKVLARLIALRKKQIHFVLGFVKDKDVEQILKLFPRGAKFYFVKAKINRASPLNEIEKIASSLQLQFTSYNSVPEGISGAQQQAEQEDLIFIGGSSFVAGEAIQ